jgi:hypothetical protein
METQVLKVFSYEVYTIDPVSKQTGWDIKFVNVIAHTGSEALHILTTWDAFDCVILFNYKEEYTGNMPHGSIIEVNHLNEVITIVLDPRKQKTFNLVEELKKQTELLRVEYLEKTKAYAAKYFAVCKERAKWKDAQWCTFLGLVPEPANKGMASEFMTFPKGFWNSKASKHYDKLKYEAKRIAKMGFDNYDAQEVKRAENHYLASCEKLAERIERKGLDQSCLTIHTAKVGVNIETTLTDGVQTVRAWTIIAEGEIQRPHYRYLVK